MIALGSFEFFSILVPTKYGILWATLKRTSFTPRLARTTSCFYLKIREKNPTQIWLADTKILLSNQIWGGFFSLILRWKHGVVRVNTLKKIGVLLNPKKRFRRCLKVSKGVESLKKKIKISTKPFSAVRNLKKVSQEKALHVDTQEEHLKVL